MRHQKYSMQYLFSHPAIYSLMAKNNDHQKELHVIAKPYSKTWMNAYLGL
jgi:hypothetical protein